MLKQNSTTAVLRILDANLNRLREGLRAVEEYFRFVRSKKVLTVQLKRLRHQVNRAGSLLDNKQLLSARNTKRDVGKTTTRSESNRQTPQLVVNANLKRCQEAARVLEEYSKLLNYLNPEVFKKIRFSLYDFEKKIILNKVTPHDIKS